MSHERFARTYWRRRGRTYEAAYIDTQARLDQEAAIIRICSELDYATVLDVGCGFGRIGALLDPVDYTGIDLSPDMLRSAAQKVPQGRFRTVSLTDFASEPFDLVLAVELLMHIRPSRVGDAVAKLRSLSKGHILTADWTKPFARGQQDAHNWIHDYPALWGDSIIREVPMSHQTVYLVESAP